MKQESGAVELAKVGGVLGVLGIAFAALVFVVIAVVTVAVLIGIGVGIRAAWLAWERHYNRTHGQRIAGGIGGRRR